MLKFQRAIKKCGPFHVKDLKKSKVQTCNLCRLVLPFDLRVDKIPRQYHEWFDATIEKIDGKLYYKITLETSEKY